VLELIEMRGPVLDMSDEGLDMSVTEGALLFVPFSFFFFANDFRWDEFQLWPTAAHLSGTCDSQ
jgi:hypothetical protein